MEGGAGGASPAVGVDTNVVSIPNITFNCGGIYLLSILHLAISLSRSPNLSPPPS
jgi:hypothetical protein